jgi:hypothetical protein
LKILNSVEREAFDFPPIFNTVERKRCFDFPTALQDIATSLRTASNQLGVARSNTRKFRQAVCHNISGSNRIESTI